MKKALIKKIFLLLFLILNSNELIALEVKAVYKIENEFNVVDPFTLFIFEPKISYKL